MQTYAQNYCQEITKYMLYIIFIELALAVGGKPTTNLLSIFVIKTQGYIIYVL